MGPVTGSKKCHFERLETVLCKYLWKFANFQQLLAQITNVMSHTLQTEKLGNRK